MISFKLEYKIGVQLIKLKAVLQLNITSIITCIRFGIVFNFKNKKVNLVEMQKFTRNYV